VKNVNNDVTIADREV